ncbi:MAG: efflux RND transporter periplasmic adaptor subunit [Thermoanaerobaculia bacterium]
MSRKTKFVVGSLAVGVAAVGLFLYSRNASAKEEGLKTVEIVRGTIVDKALAVGQIVPDQEIQVKSQISGIVKQCFVEIGDVVVPGQPLFSISPDPTPVELADASRRVELAQVAYDRAQQDLERTKSLWSGGILARDAFDARQKDFEHARITLEQETDKLQLLKEGRIQRKVGGVDSVIRASTAGTVLERKVNPGDPVVPLTSFQEGTVMLTLADMKTLEFRGTVDEIDVGKLKEGQEVRIQVGAVPGSSVIGTLTRVAPKARDKEGATVFDVEAAIDAAKSSITLRAGYSANADVIIQEKQDVLLVPDASALDDGLASVRATAAAGRRASEEGDRGWSLRRTESRGRRRAERRRQGRPASGQGSRVRGAGYLGNYLRQFLRDMRAQKLRLFLTIFGLVWGTAAVTLMLAFGEGLHRQVMVAQKGLGDAIVIAWPSRTAGTVAGPAARTQDPAGRRGHGDVPQRGRGPREDQPEVSTSGSRMSWRRSPCRSTSQARTGSGPCAA